MILGVADLSSNENNMLFVYPNPFNTNFTIEYYAAQKETVTVELYDVTGRKVVSQNQVVFMNTKNTFTLSDISILSKGIYTLRLISSAKTYNSKIIKQ